MAILNASISDLLGTPGTAIALWDAEAQVLVAPGRPPPPSDFRRGSSIATRVFETQQAMFVTDAPRADPQNAEVYRLFGANALMVAPMNAGGRSMGVVSAFADRPSIFGREDLSLLEVLARELGGFLHRRELVEQMTHVRAQEEAMRLKDEFLSAAAHDLRTPLTVIIGQTQLMERRRRQNPEAPANETAISTVLTEAQRMRDLTEDLLSISRAEAAGFIAERVPTSLGPIAQEPLVTLVFRQIAHRPASSSSSLAVAMVRSNSSIETVGVMRSVSRSGSKRRRSAPTSKSALAFATKSPQPIAPGRSK